jgi:hypothetical protein
VIAGMDACLRTQTVRLRNESYGYRSTPAENRRLLDAVGADGFALRSAGGRDMKSTGVLTVFASIVVGALIIGAA